AGGVDKMETEQLGNYLQHHKNELIKQILEGKYRPNPVRRIEIPKDNGKWRKLGIPTVVDRVVQQAIFQTLSKLYEPHFSAYSYGFRPRRNAHQALKQCRKYITEGYCYAVRSEEHTSELQSRFDLVCR